MPPKIGVYICHCGINIAGTVDVEEVTRFAQSLPNVGVARNYEYLCSDPGQELIKKDIAELGLNRVVVASCSPRMHEVTFRRVVEEAGLNPYLFAMANIREQCSWVHEDQGRATDKATSLIAGMVSRASLLRPLEDRQVEVNPSTLVVGGGIAGMQAALDIADAGFKVYLVEKEPTIGGHMAQLDKTFPTLDCSACILTPKMVDVGSHPKIELMTRSEVVDIEGYIGNFRAKVRKSAKYVDPDKCTACGDCVKECPVEVADQFNLGMEKRKAIYIAFPQAVPNKYVIERRGLSPCTHGCPLGVNGHGYVALIARGKFKEALALVREKLPFPGILGRVCTHPCENECNRSQVDQPVSIRALKRFIADLEGDTEFNLSPETEKEEKVAIVGSGPAGLMAAYELRRMGYQVTVFEALSVLGGMLRVGVPAYRLPREILDAETAIVEKIGVEIRLNTPVGENPSLNDLKEEGYRAVFLSIGCHVSKKLGIPGDELKGVWGGVEFLREVNLGGDVSVGERVVVVGGGDAAIDAARCAKRLGARQVVIVYRRSRAEMPAEDLEVERAEEEGVDIQYLAAPTIISGESGRVKTMECIRMELGEPDESGRRKPTPIKGSEFVLDVDMLIAAIGQVPDFSKFSDHGLQVKRDGTLEVDPITLATCREGIFAGGDNVRGPATVIDALADGRRAALSIDRYLKGEPWEEPEQLLPVVSAEDLELARVEKRLRTEMPALLVEERAGNFAEVEIGLSKEMAVEEALRCLNCGVCSECGECEKVCEPEAIDHGARDEEVEIDVGTIVVATGFDQFDAKLKPEFAYDRYDNVITGLEFERLSSASGPTAGEILVDGREPKRVVFIQCVGSRDQQVGNEYCSRVCCMYTAKHAHLVKEKLPHAEVTVFYTDVRAFGKGFEEFYDRVRDEGIMYRRGNASEIYRRGDGLVVRAEDTLLSETLEVEADLVVLAAGIVPRPSTKEVAGLLKLSRSADGFLAEAHPKLRPVDTAIDGVFLAGCCQGPKDIPDTVAQAKGAASSAMVLMSKGIVRVEPITASIDEDVCSGCGTCELLCEYGALSLDSRRDKMVVNEILCKGCGACAVGCPSNAISVCYYTPQQLLTQVDSML